MIQKILDFACQVQSKKCAVFLSAKNTEKSLSQGRLSWYSHRVSNSTAAAADIAAPYKGFQFSFDLRGVEFSKGKIWGSAATLKEAFMEIDEMEEDEEHHTCKRCGYAIDYIVNGQVCYCEEKD
jgi:hypothetical protein